MGYQKIQNLYREKTVLMFKEVYVMEKIHGTSAHVSWHPVTKTLHFFSGGENYEKFVALFDQAALPALFNVAVPPSSRLDCSPDCLDPEMEKVTVYGEAYGGKQQGMSATYGKDLKFVAFDVKVGEKWLSIPDAEDVAHKLGLDFVWYTKCNADVETLDFYRDQHSIQAVKNGVSVVNDPATWKKAEGVVIRPLLEMTLNNGERICAKHKRDDFQERRNQPKVSDDKLKVMEDAKEIANEWVIPERLAHVLDHIKAERQSELFGIEDTGNVINAMVEDIEREGQDEIAWTPAVRKAISTRTAVMFKDSFKL